MVVVSGGAEHTDHTNHPICTVQTGQTRFAVRRNCRQKEPRAEPPALGLLVPLAPVGAGTWLRAAARLGAGSGVAEPVGALGATVIVTLCEAFKGGTLSSLT